jgi:hypothetical protein
MDDLPSSNSPTDDLLRSDALSSIRAYASEALTETGAGAAARRRLARLDLKVDLLSSPDSQSGAKQPVLVAPNADSVGDLTLPVELNPPTRYQLDHSGEEIEIQSWFTSRPRRVSVESLQAGDLECDEFEFLPEGYFTVLHDEYQSVAEAINGRGNQQSRLPVLRAVRETDQKRMDELKDEARDVLERIRGVLFAWTLVALKGENHGPIPPKKGREAHFWPEREWPFGSARGPSDAEQESKVRMRKGIQKNFSGTGLFVREVRQIWELIVGRRLGKHRMQAVAAPLDVPPAVTDAAAFAVETLYDELVSIDQKTAALQAREVASEIQRERIADGESGDVDRTPQRETKVRAVVAHRVSAHPELSWKRKSDLNQLLSDFMAWDGKEPATRPLDAVYEAIEYSPGRGKGDVHEAMELLHDRISDFEKELGDQVVENIDLLVSRWVKSR